MISDRHMAAVEAYMSNGFNKTQALLSAKYSKSFSMKRQFIVFGREDVKAEIAKRKKRMAKKYELDQDWVIERLMDLARAGETLAPYKKVQPDGTLMWDFTDATWEELATIQDLGVEFYTEGRGENIKLEVKKFKVKTPDVQAALTALARHLSLFNDKVEITGSLAERIQEGRNRARAANAEESKTVH